MMLLWLVVKLAVYACLMVCLAWGIVDIVLGVPFRRRPTAPRWVQIVNLGALLFVIAHFVVAAFR